MGRCRVGRGWQGSDLRAGGEAWGGVAGAARAAGEALISDMARTDPRSPKCTDFRADPGALPVYMGFKCGAKCIRLLET